MNLLVCNYVMGSRRGWWMPFRPPFSTVGKWFIKNTSSCIIKQVEEAAPGIVSIQVYYLFFTMSNVLHDVTCVLDEAVHKNGLRIRPLLYSGGKERRTCLEHSTSNISLSILLTILSKRVPCPRRLLGALRSLVGDERSRKKLRDVR